jgi:hypothetical protein
VSVHTATSTSTSRNGESQWGIESDTPVRSGIGTDVSEWDEPEQLHSTPMPSPMSTPSAAASSMTPVPRIR